MSLLLLLVLHWTDLAYQRINQTLWHFIYCHSCLDYIRWVVGWLFIVLLLCVSLLLLLVLHWTALAYQIINQTLWHFLYFSFVSRLYALGGGLIIYSLSTLVHVIVMLSLITNLNLAFLGRIDLIMGFWIFISMGFTLFIKSYTTTVS
jgi:hypothetical protein